MDKNFIPILAEDLQINEFATSSIEQKYLIAVGARRFEVSKSIYELITLIDGNSDIKTLAKKYSDKLCKDVSFEDIDHILKNYLIPKGIIQSDETANKITNKQSSYLYFKLPVVSQDKLKVLTSQFKHFFSPVSLKITFVILILFHIYFFTAHGGLNVDIYSFNFESVLLVYILFFLSTLFHELGHSSACEYYGAKHGNIGLGLYLYFPVFYADVTDVWKLPRLQRAVVDFAGIYFQLIFVVLLYFLYILFKEVILIYSIYVIEFSLIFNINPFFRFDGYWIFSDLTGIPNLRQRSLETISYTFNRLIKKKNTIKPYILNIRKKERYFAYPYLIISFLFFILIFYRIVFYLPQLIGEYPSLLWDTTNAILDHVAKGLWKEAWNDFSAFVLPTIIIVMLLFMCYRMLQRILTLFFRKVKILSLR
ncbi:MAG: hypothetical protein KKB34_15055 [Bacteroidetes bacterium]|nr:hypothetical protein [Bacteroidota bacterium]